MSIFRGKLPPWAVLVLIGLSGFLLVILPNFFKWKWDYGVTHDVGIALIAACVLGFTIDRWMKAELRTDAFKAALGQLLIPEFRAEVSRIIGYKLICDRHSLIIDIEKVTKDVVKVTSSVERTIRNTASSLAPIKNYIHVDEWGFSNGKSNIIECSMTLGGKTFAGSTPIVHGDSTIRSDTAEARLPPNQTAQFRSKWIEYRRINDVLFYHFTISTVDPEIEIHCPNDLSYSIGFGVADQNIQISYYIPRKQLKGTFFPHNHMSARWWPKGAPLDGPENGGAFS